MPRVEDIRPVSPELVQLTEPGHRYLVGEGLTEREAPSLSRVLSNAGLATDYRTVDPEYLAFRANVGTYVHEWIEAQLHGDAEPTVDPFVFLHADPHIAAFMDWHGKHELVPAFSEVPSYNQMAGYACTADFVGLLDGRYAVIDWKTTSRISETVALQTMGQAQCFEVNGALFPFERFALHLPKKGRAKLVPFTKNDRDRLYVNAASICYQGKKVYL